MDRDRELSREWLEADGLGGFASGTAARVRTRRYHALLLSALSPPAERVVLVSDVEAWVETDHGRWGITTQHYAPDVFHPDGWTRATSFTAEPWPTWRIVLPDGTELEQAIVVPRGRAITSVSFRRVRGEGKCRLEARLLLAGRDFHGTTHENAAVSARVAFDRGALLLSTYAGLPEIAVRANARFDAEPSWYRRFLYLEERARGLDCEEDLFSPGTLSFDLAREDAALVLGIERSLIDDDRGALAIANEIEASERTRRASFPTPLHRAADAYLVKRGEGATIIAGYPWFGDWGRDTFIALRGICLATGRLDEAGAILREWAGAVSEGMLPNRFPDRGETPEYNSVDAALWYCVAVREYLAAASVDDGALRDAVLAIVEGYRRGTRYGIRSDDDGLIACGEPGVQLTWMDAKVGDWVVTPRVGKPVEIQALWINALDLARRWDARYDAPMARALESFGARFAIPDVPWLCDVVDVDHVPGTHDARLRPNQIFAAFGLPVSLVEGELARRVVDAVERSLFTPVGLRSLAPSEPGYVGRYEGGVRERDGGYHMGTVWPWLAGAFVDAWLRVHPNGREEARARFLAPLRAHLGEAGVGHVSEICDAEAPHTPRGCPFQAWSVGELLRIEQRLQQGIGGRS